MSLCVGYHDDVSLCVGCHDDVSLCVECHDNVSLCVGCHGNVSLCRQLFFKAPSSSCSLISHVAVATMTE